MNEARWLLEAGLLRHPGHEGLILGLVETSLRVGDARAAERVVGAISPDSPRAPYAAVLRARAIAYSGRLDEALGVLDAAEMGPTFGAEPGRVVGYVAGGVRALTESLEGAEDDYAAGAAIERTSRD